VRAKSSNDIVLVGAAVVLLASGLMLARGAPGPVDELGWLALGLAIVVAAALVGGHLAARVGQPAVLGELLAGMVLGNLPGPARLQFIGTDPYLDILSRVGMLLLLFEVGLGLSVRGLFAVGPSSLFVAVIGTASSLGVGTATATLLMPDMPIASRVFLGAAITATSVGITARVLKDLKASRSDEAHVILGAAVADDVLALVVLGAVTAWVGATPGAAAFRTTSIVALVMKTAGFLLLAIVLGLRLTPIWFRQASRLRTGDALLAVGLCFCFCLSWAASAVGLAALVGAFAAGLVLEDAHSEVFVQRGERPLGELLQPMTSLLVPVFFVLVGFRTNLAALGHPAQLAFALALSLAAVVGKLSCAIGVVNRRVRKWTVAAGMIPRGEVTLVFAALGGAMHVRQAPLLDERGYTAVVTVVILTTLVTPLALKWSMRGQDLLTGAGVAGGSASR
jgi:Kef-type K+ transport system membrane component KefB